MFATSISGSERRHRGMEVSSFPVLALRRLLSCTVLPLEVFFGFVFSTCTLTGMVGAVIAALAPFLRLNNYCVVRPESPSQHEQRCFFFFQPAVVVMVVTSVDVHSSTSLC